MQVEANELQRIYWNFRHRQIHATSVFFILFAKGDIDCQQEQGDFLMINDILICLFSEKSGPLRKKKNNFNVCATASSCNVTATAMCVHYREICQSFGLHVAFIF